MCTVSLVLPASGGYLLAANRDEHVTRGVAEPPRRDRAGANAFVAPRDADAGGTWIAVDEAGRSLCILNGDEPAIADAPPAPRSRGLLVLELLADPEPAAVAAALRTAHERGTLDVRPFQLLAVAPREGAAGVEVLRVDFDGRALALSAVVPPLVATSNGFDPRGVARARGASFRRLLSELPAPPADAERWRAALLAWHRSHADGPERGGLFSVCLHRPTVRTVSNTLIDVRRGRITLRYQPGSPCEGATAVEIAP